jgi:hypothetical protein
MRNVRRRVEHFTCFHDLCPNTVDFEGLLALDDVDELVSFLACAMATCSQVANLK